MDIVNHGAHANPIRKFLSMDASAVIGHLPSGDVFINAARTIIWLFSNIDAFYVYWDRISVTIMQMYREVLVYSYAKFRSNTLVTDDTGNYQSLINACTTSEAIFSHFVFDAKHKFQ